MGRKTSSEKPNQGGVAFGRNLMVLGAAVLALGGWGAANGLLTLKWPRASAKIINAELARTQMASSGRTDRRPEEWNSFHVLYSFKIGDRQFVSGGVEPYDFGMQNSAGAEKMRARHPVGSDASIVYDPKNPAVAYLEPGPRSFSLVLTGIGFFVGAAGWWVRSLARGGIGQMERDSDDA